MLKSGPLDSSSSKSARKMVGRQDEEKGVEEEFLYALVVPPKRVASNFLSDLKSGAVLEKVQEKTRLNLTPVKNLKPLTELLAPALEGEGLIAEVHHAEAVDIILLKFASRQAAEEMAEEIGCTVPIAAEALADRARKMRVYFNGDKDVGQSEGTRCVPCTSKGARNPYNFLHASYSRNFELVGQLTMLNRLSMVSKIVKKAILDSPEIKQHWDDADGDAGETTKMWTGIGSLLMDGDVLAAFPLHDEDRRVALVREVMSHHFVWRRSYERFVERDVHAYFGTAVAFYFCFLSHYSRWLRILVVDGVALSLTKNTNVTGGCGVIAVVWCFGMLRAWADRESRLALRWGMLSSSSEETGSKATKQYRSGFVGKKGAIDPVTGSTKYPYYPETLRRKKQRFSYAVVAFGLLVAAFNVVLCKAIRIALVLRHFPALPSTILNAIFVFFLNNGCLGIATRCAENENHKYDSEYEAAVFDYVLVFRVVNSFATLFYTAYIKERLEGRCAHDSCFDEAGHSAFVFFLVQLTVGNLLEIGPAMIKYRKSRNKRKPTNPVDLAMSQFSLAESPTVEVLDDYLEITIQFGYCVLFFVCCPFAPILALANNLAEAKIDCLKRLSKRRPAPTDQKTIKTYTDAILYLAYLAIINNVALFCFLRLPVTEESVPNFFKSTLGLLAISAFIYTSRGAESMPHDVDLQLRRQSFVLSRHSGLILDHEQKNL